MPRCRGEANQALYRAQVLLDCWDRERGSARHPERVLREAFLPAVRLHLVEAYGWFLLAVSGVEEAVPARRPGCVADLPAPEPGRSSPPELQEFGLLENSGWLGDMLAAGVSGEHPVPAPRAGAALIGSDAQAPDFARAAAWAEKLEETMARMDDSLAEC